jgi:hypothetical protein
MCDADARAEVETLEDAAFAPGRRWWKLGFAREGRIRG